MSYLFMILVNCANVVNFCSAFLYAFNCVFRSRIAWSIPSIFMSECSVSNSSVNSLNVYIGD